MREINDDNTNAISARIDAKGHDVTWYGEVYHRANVQDVSAIARMLTSRKKVPLKRKARAGHEFPVPSVEGSLAALASTGPKGGSKIAIHKFIGRHQD